ncbi:MAG: ACP S-malonyltransferase [Deltaproteobacteria bacterium]
MTVSSGQWSVVSGKNGALAFIFPGQGSQYIGMGREFHEKYAAAREIFKEASVLLHLDMARLCFEGPVEALNLTQNTQPAILTASVAILKCMEQEVSVKPAFLAGHSLGEYTALVAAGAIDFKDALRLVEMRGRIMQDAVPHGTGAMAAILGLTGDVVEEICNEVSAENGIVVPANFNSPEQTVISGHREAVERASILAKKRKAKRVIPLPVSVPSHSPLMKPAAERLGKELGRIEIKTINIPVITNVEAEPLLSKERVKGLLEKQLYSPVRWVESVKRMRQEGVETVIEIGPGRILTGLVKRIDSGIKTLNIEKPEDVKQLMAHS